MLRSSLLLVRQTRLGCRHFRQRRDDWVPETNSTGALQSRIAKNLAFSVGTTTLFYTGSTLMLYENKRAALLKRTAHPVREWYDRFSVVKWWRTQTPAKKLFYGILAVNGVVYVMWQIPRYSSIMYKYFTLSSTSNIVSPMLLSVFSHNSALHLGCNMLVLYSFIDVAVNLMGKEQFLATYLSGGVASSLVSNIGKLCINKRAVSLGASGAIVTTMALVCMAYPNSQMQIIFLPMMTFKAITGLKGLVAFDTIGLLSKWSFFDHAAHLGGALFGIGYFLGGNKLYNMYHNKLLQYWDRIRSSRKDR